MWSRRAAAVPLWQSDTTAGGFDDREISRVLSAAHAAVGQIRIQGQAFAAMADHAAKGFDRVGLADLRQVSMAGQAIFHLAGQAGRQGNRFNTATRPTRQFPAGSTGAGRKRLRSSGAL